MERKASQKVFEAAVRRIRKATIRERIQTLSTVIAIVMAELMVVPMHSEQIQVGNNVAEKTLGGPESNFTRCPGHCDSERADDVPEKWN